VIGGGGEHGCTVAQRARNELVDGAAAGEATSELADHTPQTEDADRRDDDDERPDTWAEHERQNAAEQGAGEHRADGERLRHAIDRGELTLGQLGCISGHGEACSPL